MEVKNVFVNLIEFPALKEGKEEEFREWFEWSNVVYAAFDGFISRRLLRSKEGAYVGLVEHESEETFMAMHLRGRKHGKRSSHYCRVLQSRPFTA